MTADERIAELERKLEAMEQRIGGLTSVLKDHSSLIKSLLGDDSDLLDDETMN